MQCRLRTLLIVLALGPMVLAWWGWPTLKSCLASKTAPLPPAIALPARNPPPYFAAYDIGNADRATIESNLRTKLAGVPASFQRYYEPGGRLAVWGVASAHDIFQVTIREMQNPPQDSN